MWRLGLDNRYTMTTGQSGNVQHAFKGTIMKTRFAATAWIIASGLIVGSPAFAEASFEQVKLELTTAVRRVADGDAVFSPRRAGFVLDAFAATTEVADVDEDLDRLSQREREVLRLIARGYTYKEVGKALFISVKTVETHVSAVLRKLQLSNRHELTRWATARRLV